VRSWSRSGAALQVWLQRPVADTTLRLTGWLPPGDAAADFRLPALPVSSARTQKAFVHVSAGDGLALRPEGLRELRPLPDPSASRQEHSFVTDRPDYGGLFHLYPAGANADVRALTLAEVVDRSLTFTAVLDYRVRRGELRSLAVGLRNWQGGEVHFEGAGLARVREQPRRPDGRSWVLE